MRLLNFLKPKKRNLKRSILEEVHNYVRSDSENKSERIKILEDEFGYYEISEFMKWIWFDFSRLGEYIVEENSIFEFEPQGGDVFIRFLEIFDDIGEIFEFDGKKIYLKDVELFRAYFSGRNKDDKNAIMHYL